MGSINERFNRFLYGSDGRGLVGTSLDTMQTRFLPPQFCSDLHEAMKKLCNEGAITLSVLRSPGTKHQHGHVVTIKPNPNNSELPYSIHAKDHEPWEKAYYQSNALVNNQGEAFPYSEKPLCEFLVNGENSLLYKGRSAENELKFPIVHIAQALQNHQATIVKLAQNRRTLNLAEDSNQLPSSVIEGLNSISDVLRPFNSKLSYEQASDFGKG